MVSFSYSCLNKGEPSFCHAVTGSRTCVDLSFVSTSALLDFTWRVLEDDYGSGHFPVNLTLALALHVRRWRFRAAKWPAFSAAT